MSQVTKFPSGKIRTSFSINSNVFIFRFAEIVRPLRDLASTKEKYEWKNMHQKAFEEIKEKLSEDVLNNHFEENRETYANIKHNARRQLVGNLG